MHWSDCMDTQADLSICCSHATGFLASGPFINKCTISLEELAWWCGNCLLFLLSSTQDFAQDCTTYPARGYVMISSTFSIKILYLQVKTVYSCWIHPATGLSAVCDCVISWSYSLTFLDHFCCLCFGRASHTVLSVVPFSLLMTCWENNDLLAP